MKKAIIMLIGIGIILSFTGCADSQNNKAANSTAQAVSSTQPETTQSTENTEKEQSTVKATIAGIRLGDSIETLNDKFGPVIKETPLEQPNYMGENVSKLEYKNGATLFVDKNTKTILEITVDAQAFETNLGVKLGDRAEDVIGKYNTKYKLFKGDNSEDYLKGWYTVEEGELLIFDFKKGDDTHYNGEINKDEKVVSITLSHPKYFD